MTKISKVIASALIIFIAIILFSLVFSPFLSLLLPVKLANHTYYRLLYNIIADRETRGCSSDEGKALNLFRYTADRLFHQGTPYECKPAESFIYGEAYCDFKARALNELLGVAGIKSRYAMLLDRNNSGISAHTLNEVLLNGKWCVFDPSLNIIFRDSDDDFISLDDMSGDFNLIRNERKFTALKNYDRKGYDNFVLWFEDVFPIVYEPRRSTPRLLQKHIFDDILDAYYKLFGGSFVNFYQNAYLNFKKKYPEGKDFQLFFLARNYHLAYRYNLALTNYNLLLRNFPQSKYKEDAIFFSGLLYFDLRDYPRAIEYFRIIVDRYPVKWSAPAYYYLGKAYCRINEDEVGMEAYSHTDELKLDAGILERLNGLTARQY